MLSDRELEEWLVFHRAVCPLPDPYWIGGRIASVIASCFGKKSYVPEDFMPIARREPRRLTPEESAGSLKRMMEHG